MYFESLSDFIHMGGYASYVWSAFLITILSGIFLLVLSRNSKKKTFRSVEEELKRKKRIEAAKDMEGTL